MSGNLFPIKLLHLFLEMQDKGVLAKLTQAAQCIKVQSPEDGLVRLVLCSPEVQQTIASTLGTRQIRVRIAVPTDLSLLPLARLAQLEVYGATGEPLQSPIKLVELDNAVANAVQVELFHEVLRAHGSSIPLL